MTVTASAARRKSETEASMHGQGRLSSRSLAAGRRGLAVAAAAAMSLLLAACTPQVEPGGGEHEGGPRLSRDLYIAADGAGLPLTRWPAEQEQAVVLALHGFNDYRGVFSWSAPALAAQGVSVYAYDQRGFGETATAGRWPGEAALIADAADMLALLRRRHGDTPLYLLGHSMGAAVAIAAAAGRDDVAARIDGVILAAPAVWGWSQLNGVYEAALWTTAHLAPGWRLSGEGLERKPTDNAKALAEMARDPYVIKRSRADSLYGLVTLMDTALAQASELETPALVVYGENDEIVPVATIETLIARLPEKTTRVRAYETGWHMLLRDKQRGRVLTDIAAFMLGG